MPTVEDIVRLVRGTLSVEACATLRDLAGDIPSGGTILDLSPGEGRSTLALALGVQASGKEQRIIAVDSHVTNPRASKPLEEGTLMAFLSNLRIFNCVAQVIPVITSPSNLDEVLNKRSVNLAVVQVPSNHVDKDAALSSALDIAKNVIRKGGKIVVQYPQGLDIIEP